MNYPTNMLPLICDCRNLLAREWWCTCTTCTVKQTAMQTLWQSGGPANRLGRLCIVIVPLLCMYYILGMDLA